MPIEIASEKLVSDVLWETMLWSLPVTVVLLGIIGAISVFWKIR
jgi:uncharacterized membrane protein YqjE